MTVEIRQIILTEDRHTLKDKTYGSNLWKKGSAERYQKEFMA